MEYRINEKINHKDGESYLETILRARGIENYNDYLNASAKDLLDPLLLKNMDIGAEAFIRHIKNNSKIFLIVDCDNDGVTSAAEIYLFAKKINPEVQIDWMMHDGKQHGIELDKIPEDIDFLIIPDASSNQKNEHIILTEKGVSDILVLDHHLAEEDQLDSPAIIINNQVCDYPNKELSGAGVVFKFIEYCCNKLGLPKAETLSFLDLAAVGMIGDMVSLKNLETRYIVSEGLSHLNNPGIQAFVRKQAFSIGRTEYLTPTDVSFYITPLINAVIRVGTMDEKETLFRAFINGNDKEQSTKRGAKPGDLEVIGDKAARLAANCKSRQTKAREKSLNLIDMKIQKEELNDNKVLIIALNDYESDQVNPNLTGLIAMEVLAKYKKPTLLMREADDGVFKGSGRSDDCSKMSHFKNYLSNTGLVEYAEGHEAAFGCGVKAKNLERLNDMINSEFEGINLSDTSYLVDFVFDKPNDDIAEIAEIIEKYNYVWGRGIEEPLVAVQGIVNTSKLFVMGADKSSAKISINGLDCVKFKDLDFIQEMQKYSLARVDFIGRLKLNYYNGTVTPQLFIDDYEIKQTTIAF